MLVDVEGQVNVEQQLLRSRGEALRRVRGRKKTEKTRLRQLHNGGYSKYAIKINDSRFMRFSDKNKNFRVKKIYNLFKHAKKN